MREKTPSALQNALPVSSSSPGTLDASDIKTVFLGGLFIIAVFAVCYAAAAIILPIILAVVLKLVLQPVMRTLEKLYLPPFIAALIIICLLLGGFFGLGTVLSVPAAKWTQQLPHGITRLQDHLDGLMGPLKATQDVIQNAEGMTQSSDTKPVTVAIEGSRLSDKLLTHTQGLISGLGETILVLFFLLASGDIFLRRFIEVLPRFQDKRQAVLITQQIETDLSAYLATITFMNTLVGVATGFAMYFCGLSDPILWGTAAFLLNYVPILGPLIGVVIFSLVGVLSMNTLSSALVPAASYVVIFLIEGTALTPILLAKRFTLNPVLVILSVIFWYWMWGVAGAILSTPMLAAIKIICDRTQPLMPFGHFMEG